MNHAILDIYFDEINEVLRDESRRKMLEFIKFLENKDFYVEQNEALYSQYTDLNPKTNKFLKEKSGLWDNQEDILLDQNWNDIISKQKFDFCSTNYDNLILKTPKFYDMINDELLYMKNIKGAEKVGNVKLRGLILDFVNVTRLYQRIGHGILRRLMCVYCRLRSRTSKIFKLTGKIEKAEIANIVQYYNVLIFKTEIPQSEMFKHLSRCFKRPIFIVMKLIETLKKMDIVKTITIKTLDQLDESNLELEVFKCFENYVQTKLNLNSTIIKKFNNFTLTKIIEHLKVNWKELNRIFQDKGITYFKEDDLNIIKKKFVIYYHAQITSNYVPHAPVEQTETLQNVQLPPSKICALSAQQNLMEQHQSPNKNCEGPVANVVGSIKTDESELRQLNAQRLLNFVGVLYYLFNTYPIDTKVYSESHLAWKIVNKALSKYDGATSKLGNYNCRTLYHRFSQYIPDDNLVSFPLIRKLVLSGTLKETIIAVHSKLTALIIDEPLKKLLDKFHNQSLANVALVKDHTSKLKTKPVNGITQPHGDDNNTSINYSSHYDIDSTTPRKICTKKKLKQNDLKNNTRNTSTVGNQAQEEKQNLTHCQKTDDLTASSPDTNISKKIISLQLDAKLIQYLYECVTYIQAWSSHIRFVRHKHIKWDELALRISQNITINKTLNGEKLQKRFNKLKQKYIGPDKMYFMDIVKNLKTEHLPKILSKIEKEVEDSHDSAPVKTNKKSKIKKARKSQDNFKMIQTIEITSPNGSENIGCLVASSKKKLPKPVIKKSPLTKKAKLEIEVIDGNVRPSCEKRKSSLHGTPSNKKLKSELVCVPNDCLSQKKSSQSSSLLVCSDDYKNSKLVASISKNKLPKSIAKKSSHKKKLKLNKSESMIIHGLKSHETSDGTDNMLVSNCKDTTKLHNSVKKNLTNKSYILSTKNNKNPDGQNEIVVVGDNDSKLLVKQCNNINLNSPSSKKFKSELNCISKDCPSLKPESSSILTCSNLASCKEVAVSVESANLSPPYQLSDGDTRLITADSLKIPEKFHKIDGRLSAQTSLQSKQPLKPFNLEECPSEPNYINNGPSMPLMSIHPPFYAEYMSKAAFLPNNFYYPEEGMNKIKSLKNENFAYQKEHHSMLPLTSHPDMPIGSAPLFSSYQSQIDANGNHNLVNNPHLLDNYRVALQHPLDHVTGENVNGYNSNRHNIRSPGNLTIYQQNILNLYNFTYNNIP